jgi:hypothetical protein
MPDVGKHELQWAFVLRADHPRYQLRLEDGSTIGTSMHESWLQPRYATWRGNPNGFAPDQDDHLWRSGRPSVPLGAEAR